MPARSHTPPRCSPHTAPGYDYTFLCALHPSMRQRWAAAWARHLVPGGELVTMVYPVDTSMDPAPGARRLQALLTPRWRGPQ